MNLWENTVLTDQGKALQAKLLKGQTLKIRRVTTGAKKVPVVDLRQQTSVTEGGFDITLQPARTEGDSTILSVLLENRGLKESYELWQVGFYAEDPDEGEILFCLAQASQVKNIPSEAESPGFSITWDFYFNTSNTVPFEVVLNSAGLVNIEAYQAHTEAIRKVNSRINSIDSALERVALQGASVVNSWSDQANISLDNFRISRTGIYLITLYVRFCGAVHITKVGASVSAGIEINGNPMIFAQRGKINIPISKIWDQPNCITLPGEFAAGDLVQINFMNETGITSDTTYDTLLGWQAILISE